MDLLWRPDTPTTASSTALQPVYTTYLWVVGAQLINGTELDQFLIDAEKGTEESMSRLCTGPIFLDGWNQNHQLQDNDRDEAFKPTQTPDSSLLLCTLRQATAGARTRQSGRHLNAMSSADVSGLQLAWASTLKTHTTGSGRSLLTQGSPFLVFY